MLDIIMTDVSVSVATNEFETDAGNKMLHKIVKVSPQSVGYIKLTANSASSSSIQFKVPVSRNQLLSRKILVEVPITMKVTTTDNLRHFASCLRADALNRLITNITIRVNGGTVTADPARYCELLQFYDRDDDDYFSSDLLLAPNVPDMRLIEKLPQFGDANFTTFDSRTPSATLAENGNDDRLYHFRTINSTNRSLTSRNSYPFVQSGNTAIDGAGDAVVFRQYTARYVLKHPLLSSNHFDTLANVHEMEIVISLDSGQVASKAIVSTVPRIHTGEAVVPDGSFSAQVGVIDGADIKVNTSDFLLFARTYAPSSIDNIPIQQIVPAQRFYVNDALIGDVASGAEAPINHPTIRVNQVPESILIAVLLSEGKRSPTLGDYFALISNLQIRINSKPQDYSNFDKKDFYDLCVRNGLQMRYQDFDPEQLTIVDTLSADTKGVGMVLHFKPSRDFSGELKENLLENGLFQLDISYKMKNTLATTQNFTSRIALVNGVTFTLQADTPVQEFGGITEQEYSSALASGSVIGFLGEDHDRHQILGGSFLKDVKKGLNFVVKPLTTVANLASPFLPPEFKPAVPVLNAVDRALGSGMMGAGKLGGMTQMSRADQMRRLGLA